MTNGKDDPFDLKKLVLPIVRERRGIEPKKIQKRRAHFVKVPWVWVEQLDSPARPIA